MAKKKIYPTLWWLFRDGLLPKNTHIIGYARSHLTVSELVEHFEAFCNVRDEEKDSFSHFIRHCSYISVSFIFCLINN